MATYTIPSTHTSETQFTQLQWISWYDGWDISGYGWVDEGTNIIDAVAGDKIVFNVNCPPTPSQNAEEAYDIEKGIRSAMWQDSGDGSGTVKFEFPDNKLTLSSDEANGVVPIIMTVTGKHTEVDDMEPIPITVLEVVHGDADIEPSDDDSDEQSEDEISVLGTNAVQFLKEKVEASEALAEAYADGNLGKAKVLTSADWDYPSSDPKGFDVGTMPTGVYKLNGDTRLYYNGESFFYTATSGDIYVSNENGNGTVISNTEFNGSEHNIVMLKDLSNKHYAYNVLSNGDIKNNLTTTSSNFVLDARQGKVLNDKIEGRVKQNAGAPTTATVGTVGQLLEDTTNGKLYQCTAADTVTPSYTWAEVGAGGSGITELTTADYNYPTDNPNCIALWLLEPGVYYKNSDVYIKRSASSNRETDGIQIIEVGGFYTAFGENFRQIAQLRNTDSGTIRLFAVSASGGLSNVYSLSPQNVVQGTGTSTADIMSQAAVSKMIYGNNDGYVTNKRGVRIGDNISIGSGNSSYYSVMIGKNQKHANSDDGSTLIGPITQPGATGMFTSGDKSTTLGIDAVSVGNYGIAIGAYAKATQQGEMNIGLVTGNTTQGYNSSAYRLLTGLYDPQSDHDAATKGYVDTAISALQAEIGDIEARLHAINFGESS